MGSQTAWNIYGINLIARKVGVDTLIYMYNGHADVTALLDTSGNVIATYYYDAFGNILSSTGSADNSILYAGYQYDEETGLYYLNARMYDPVTARFIQEDTYRGDPNDPLTLNLYTYCANNPLIYNDPSGHMFIEGSGALGNVSTDSSNNSSALLIEPIITTEKTINIVKRVIDLVQTAGSFIGKSINLIPKIVNDKDYRRDFATGFSESMLNNMTFTLLEHVQNVTHSHPRPEHDDSYYFGKITGDFASVLFGGVLITGGGVVEVGGIAFDATGVGAPIGVGLNVAGATAIVYGTGTMTSALANIGSDFDGFMRAESNGGGGASNGNSGKKINANDVDLDQLPDGWSSTENNGFVHVKDPEGNIRIRIDPSDKVTNYRHKHIYDEFGNSLDIDGNIVDPKSIDAHIPIEK